MSLIVVAFSSCKKDDDTDTIIGYYQIESERHDIKSAACFYHSGSNGYNIVFSDDENAGLCANYEATQYNIFEFDIPTDIIGKTLTEMEDDFNCDDWLFICSVMMLSPKVYLAL